MSRGRPGSCVSTQPAGNQAPGPLLGGGTLLGGETTFPGSHSSVASAELPKAAQARGDGLFPVPA